MAHGGPGRPDVRAAIRRGVHRARDVTTVTTARSGLQVLFEHEPCRCHPNTAASAVPPHAHTNTTTRQRQRTAAADSRIDYLQSDSAVMAAGSILLGVGLATTESWTHRP